MVIELTSSRIIIPVIGSSVYAWTSVIGVIFLGLSIGNYAGGRAVDKNPPKKTLALFLLLSSVSISITPFTSTKIPDFLQLNQSIIFISLSASLVSFLLPAICLGLLYPAILKIYSSDIKDIGKQYGLISASFSLGGILGTFLTGFYLVGRIGSSNTFFVISLILFSLALALILSQKLSLKLAVALIIAAVILPLLIYGFSKTKKDGKNTIFSSESNYYKIKVVKSVLDFAPVKMLLLDADIHSAERIDGNDLPIYTNIYPVFTVFNDKIKKALVIGGGSYFLAKKISEFYPDSSVTVSEIDPVVTSAADNFFDLKKYNIKTINADGRFYLQRTPDKYDLIFGDAFNSFISIPWHLATVEFNEIVKNKLNNNGVYAINFIAPADKKNNVFLNSMIKTFETSFDNFYTFAYGDANTVAQNIVMVGVKSKRHFSEKELINKIKKLKNGDNISLRLRSKEHPLGWENGQVLTDDFAPLEKLSMSMIKDYWSAYSKLYMTLVKAKP